MIQNKNHSIERRLTCLMKLSILLFVLEILTLSKSNVNIIVTGNPHHNSFYNNKNINSEKVLYVLSHRLSWTSQFPFRWEGENKGKIFDHGEHFDIRTHLNSAGRVS